MRSEGADLRADLGPVRNGLKSERADLRPKRAGLMAKRADCRPERLI